MFTSSSSRFAVFAATLVIVVTGFTSSADATKMLNTSPGFRAAMSDCLAASDSQMITAETRTACCSKEAGICVICPKPESVGMMCEVKNYGRQHTPEGLAPRAGSSIKGKS